MKIILALLLLVTYCHDGVHSQTKRMRRDDLTVRVETNVKSLTNDYFRYHYMFTNAKSSHQSMSRVVIELHDQWVEHGGTLRSVTYPREKDWGEFPTVGRTMRWNAGYDTTGIDVLERPPRSVILPGEYLNFGFESKGLPAIGTYCVAGWAPWYFTGEEKDSLLKEGYPESDLEDSDRNGLQGITITPLIPQSPFIPFAFLDTLLSYIHQSHELGWINNTRDDDAEEDEKAEDGIVKNLNKRLETAQDLISKGRNNQAVNHLQRFLIKVEKLWTRQQKEEEKKKKNPRIIFTSEAYALLKYNCEYLLDHLPTTKGGKEDKK